MGKYNPSSLTQGDYLPGRDLVYQPRQCYWAFQTLARTLGPYHFERQLTTRGGDYALEFRDGDETRVVAWTEGSPHAATIPIHGLSHAIGITGQAPPNPAPSSQGILLTLTQSAQYLVPCGGAGSKPDIGSTSHQETSPYHAMGGSGWFLYYSA